MIGQTNEDRECLNYTFSKEEGKEGGAGGGEGGEKKLFLSVASKVGPGSQETVSLLAQPNFSKGKGKVRCWMNIESTE